MKAFAAIALLCAAISLQAQSAPQVVVTGNSIAQYEFGLASNIFPDLPEGDVYITGHPSYTCADVLAGVTYDVFGAQNRERSPQVAVLIDTTNDWQPHPPTNMSTRPSELLSCLQQTAQALLTIKPRLKIVFLTTPPYVPASDGGCTQGDYRLVIEAYNDLMPELASSNVTVLDAFTPFELGTSGYADPAKMMGPCGIHPGCPGVWDAGQIILGNIYNSTVMNLLKTPEPLSGDDPRSVSSYDTCTTM
jgi:hypothetical protein